MRNILLALLLCSVAFADDATWTVNGSFIQNPKTCMDLGTGRWTFCAGTADPTAVPQGPANPGSLYCRNYGTGPGQHGDCYVKQDSGLSTNWLHLGEPGSIGVTGRTGATGVTGHQGVSGVSGSSGKTGASGKTGQTGLTGSSGATGSSGSSGQSGKTGASGSSGATGQTGGTGSSGATGQSGQSGASGLSGTTGATGQTGPSGNDGATGSSGQSGSSGSSGNSGQTGATGQSGQSGASGLSGSSGSSGSTGQTGPSGNDGAVGASGKTGQTGGTGNDGAVGAQGASGKTGQTGGTGQTGPTGSVASLTSAHILVGNVSNAPTDVALSGDCTMANTGAITCTTLNAVPPSAAPGTATSITTRDSNGDLPDYDPSYVTELFEDFIGYNAISGSTSAWFQSASSGTGAFVIPAGGSALVDTGHPGIAQMSLGTTTTGKFVAYSSNAFTGGAGTLTMEWLMYWTALSDNTNTYSIVMGFGDSFTYQTVISGFSNCVAFAYTNGTNSGNFTVASRLNGSGTTTTNTTTAPTINAWQKFKIVINAAATLATFYVNGVSIGTTTSNIPNASTKTIMPYFSATKSAGTVNAQFNLDYVKVKQVFTTPR